jgi:hypothetical protein
VHSPDLGRSALDGPFSLRSSGKTNGTVNLPKLSAGLIRHRQSSHCELDLTVVQLSPMLDNRCVASDRKAIEDQSCFGARLSQLKRKSHVRIRCRAFVDRADRAPCQPCLSVSQSTSYATVRLCRPPQGDRQRTVYVASRARPDQNDMLTLVSEPNPLRGRSPQNCRAGSLDRRQRPGVGLRNQQGAGGLCGGDAAWRCPQRR